VERGELVNPIFYDSPPIICLQIMVMGVSAGTFCSDFFYVGALTFGLGVRLNLDENKRELKMGVRRAKGADLQI